MTGRGKAGKNNKCNSCKKNVTKDDKGVACEYCNQWYHSRCAEVSDALYELMSAQGEQIHWFCNACNGKAVDVIKLVQGMKERQDQIEERLDTLDEKVDTVLEIKEPYDKKLRSIIREEFHEEKDKIARKPFLVIKGLQEAENEEGSQEVDKQKVEEMMGKILEEEEEQIAKVDRMGKRQNGRNRPLRVQLKDPGKRGKILSATKKLRESEKWKEVFISPDLTRKEREQGKLLRDKLKER